MINSYNQYIVHRCGAEPESFKLEMVRIFNFSLRLELERMVEQSLNR